MINDFKNKRITVMGLGLHGGGVATVKWLIKQGAKVLVTDLKAKKELAPSLKKLKGLGAEYVLGRHRARDFKNTDLVVANPGVLWNSKYLQIARQNGVPVENDASLFFRVCPLPIIGVTGTKGKSTTVALIHEILKKAGVKIILVGHNQIPVLGRLHSVREILASPSRTKVRHATDLVLFELSSWRLAGLEQHKISPWIAVLTNIMPDHLNYYSSMKEYLYDKEIILRYQKPSDFAILNRDNLITRELGGKAVSQRYWFSKKYFGEENGVFLENRNVKRKFYWNSAHKGASKHSLEPAPHIDAGAASPPQPYGCCSPNFIFFRKNGREEEICSVNDIRLAGEHNLENVLAAITAAKIVGIPSKTIKTVLKSFKGIADRMELVRTLKGVKYYNDTTATTPEAAIAALETFKPRKVAPRPRGRQKNIILITGGADKKLEFKEFSKAIRKYCKAVILLPGTATNKIIKLLRVTDYELRVTKTMSEAVRKASKLAEGGDIVLLSPGCASFGLFKHEFDRGEQFRKAVKSL